MDFILNLIGFMFTIMWNLKNQRAIRKELIYDILNSNEHSRTFPRMLDLSPQCRGLILTSSEKLI